MFTTECLPEYVYERMCTRKLFTDLFTQFSLSLLCSNDCILGKSVFVFHFFIERSCFLVAKLVIVSNEVLVCYEAPNFKNFTNHGSAQR